MTSPSPPHLKHRSLADICTSVLSTYDNSTDNGLYRPHRRNIAASLHLIDTSFTTPHKAAKKAVLPSYRAVSSRVGSIRRRKRRENEGEVDISKEKELEMRNEMMLEMRHEVLRTMKRELRRLQADLPHTSLTDQFHSRFRIQMRQLTHPDDHQVVWKCEGKTLFQKPKLLPSSEAKTRADSIHRRNWSQKHGKYIEENTLKMTCQEIFNVLDLKGEEVVKKEKVIWLLVALGVQIEVKALIGSVRKYTGGKEEMDVQGFVRYVNDRSPMVGMVDRLKEKEGKERLEGEAVFPYLTQELGRLRGIWELLESSWNLLDPQRLNRVAVSALAPLLLRLHLATETHSALHLSHQISLHRSHLSKDLFLSFFIRPLLKLHLDVLNTLITHWKKRSQTVTQRLLELTRTVIMAGLRYKAERCQYAKEVIPKLMLLDDCKYENYEEFKAFLEKLLGTKPENYTEKVTISTKSSLKTSENHTKSVNFSPPNRSLSPHISHPTNSSFSFSSLDDPRFSPHPALSLFLS